MYIYETHIHTRDPVAVPVLTNVLLFLLYAMYSHMHTCMYTNEQGLAVAAPFFDKINGFADLIKNNQGQYHVCMYMCTCTCMCMYAWMNVYMHACSF